MAVIEIIEDIGIADVFTVRAATAISGGMWVVPTSGAWANAIDATGTVAVFDSNNVTSASVAASGTLRPIGLAIKDVASGTSSYVGVIRNGTVILPANGTISVGNVVASSNAAAATAMITDSAGYGDVVGMAYSDAASGGYAIVRLMV